MSHTRGRQPTGIDQPPNSGSTYPFVRVSDDIEQLFADFFLSYEGLLAGQTVKYAYPFRLAWCYGFGTVPASPAGPWPAPTHTHDVVVHDANGVLVFDSTTSTTFSTSTWDSRLAIYEWRTANRVCRCVVHTAWSAEDEASGLNRGYATKIVPTISDLVADTCYEVPPRVRSISVNDGVYTAKAIEFSEGYNVSLSETGRGTLGLGLPQFAATSTDLRTSSRVVFDATAGNGLGRFPGCGETTPVLRTINYQKPDAHQNFLLDAEGCLRWQRPVLLQDDAPRTFVYGRTGSTTAQAAASLQLSNDCSNCCDCEYFARTYQGIKRQWFLFRDIAQSLEATRDLHAANRDRWLAEKTVREADMLRVRAVIEGGSKVAWGISLCNTSSCCLVGLKIYLTWVQYVDGIAAEPTILPYNCSQTMLDNSSNCSGPVPIRPIVYGDNQQLHCYVVDYVDAQHNLVIYGRQCIADAQSRPYGSTKLVLHAMVEWDATQEESAASETCLKTPLETSEIADAVQTVWTQADFTLPEQAYAQKQTDLKIVDPSDPYCLRCQCEE